MKTVEVEPTADGRGLWWRTYAYVPDDDPRPAVGTAAVEWTPLCKCGRRVIWIFGEWRHDDSGAAICPPASWRPGQPF